jgi:hypothetical protein
MEQLRAACRTRHLSPRTEEAYCHWTRRFIVHHQMRHPAELGPHQVAAFLTTLATRDHVRAATQNQAFSALLFLYAHVLQRPIGPLPVVNRVRRHHACPSSLPGVRSAGCWRSSTECRASSPCSSTAAAFDCSKLCRSASRTSISNAAH